MVSLSGHAASLGFAYTVERSARRRRSVALVVRPDGSVVVRAPVRMASRDIVAFVCARADWVWERLAALATAPPPSARQFADGEQMLVDGVPLPLEVAAEIGRPRARIELVAGALRLQCAFDATEAQRGGWLARWYHERTLERAQLLVAGWSDVMDVQPAGLVVRDQKRRWGSCSAANVIRFNWRLSMLPPEVFEYVVVHELSHIRHHNHSPAFWAELARWLPSFAELRAALRAFERLIDW